MQIEHPDSTKETKKDKKGQQQQQSISKKEPYRFMSLKDLAAPKLANAENFPVRVLGRIEGFISMSNLDALFEEIQEDKGMTGCVFYHDLSHKKYIKLPGMTGADCYMKAILGMEDLNLLVDLKNLPSDAGLSNRDLLFLSGNIVKENGVIPCLVVDVMTPAKELNLELYEKTIFLLKELVIGSDQTFMEKIGASA